ncbi:MAG: outer membrane protein assembly factor BamD, partial [Myxococcota bacterium]
RFGLRPLAALAVLVLVAAGIPEAVGPTREHHARVAAIRAALRARCPAAVVIGPAQARFFQQLHLPETCARTAIRRSPIGATVRDAEDWLRRLEPRLEPGAVLVTGLPSYVYYACTDCGLRQSRFAAPLDSRWAPLAELPALAYDEEREPARLWEWRGERAPDSRAAQAATAPMLPAEELFELGIERFDALDYPGTRTYMSAVAERFPRHERAPRAAYFFAVSYWREEDPLRTIREFEALLAEFPESRQEGAAYYHIGLSYRLLHRPEEARVALERAVQEGAPQDPSRGHAARALGGPAGAAPLEAWGRRWTELVYAFHGWPAP